MAQQWKISYTVNGNPVTERIIEADTVDYSSPAWVLFFNKSNEVQTAKDELREVVCVFDRSRIVSVDNISLL